MNADAVLGFVKESANSLGEALYFNGVDRGLFGWLHCPTTDKCSGIGIVVCNAFGFEAICSHRSVRGFAQAAAASGFPVLRFDYSGTGDSEDIDPEADQIELWVRDVRSAVAEIRQRTGVASVCLMGIRLGTLIASLAADEATRVDSLIMISPIVSGRRYARELRNTRLAASLWSGAESVAESATSGAQSETVTPFEVSGFPLASKTMSSLSKADLSAIETVSGRQILIFDDSTLPTAKAWSEKLGAHGVEAEYTMSPEAHPMIKSLPHLATVPDTMFATACDWLLRCDEKRESARRGAGKYYPPPAVCTAPIMTLHGHRLGHEVSVTERPVFIGRDAVLFGVVTEPPKAEIGCPAVILLNAGATYHVGTNRMYVSLARRWARRGCVVLRLDLSGMGDSATRSGESDNNVFPPKALDDVRCAVDFLRGHYAVKDIALTGLCSGAYHALHAAAAGLPVSRVLVVNLQDYFSTEDPMEAEIHLKEVMQAPTVYRGRVLSYRSWKKLLTGRADVGRILRVNTRRASFAIEQISRNYARRLGIRLPRDLGWELERIIARGVHVAFVFSSGEPGLDMLKLQAGSTLGRLGNHCHVHIVNNSDHVFSDIRRRSELEQILTEELFAPSAAQESRPLSARRIG
jgi:alpha-beta hydrolase superfamily lysophospholipase